MKTTSRSATTVSDASSLTVISDKGFSTTGKSSIVVTVIETVAVSNRLPSLAVKVNESLPL